MKQKEDDADEKALDTERPLMNTEVGVADLEAAGKREPSKENEETNHQKLVAENEP